MYLIKYNWLILFLIFISPFIVWSMISILSVWICIELNLIVFIVFLIKNNLNIYNLSIKYYLINSFSSSIFIFIYCLRLLRLNELIYIIINFIMVIKLGIFPFHFWFIDLIINLNWIRCLILSTWQKFIPYIILIYIYNLILILLIILTSGLLTIFYGINQVLLKKILSYSSILHISWIIYILILNEFIWIIYFINYIFINLSVILIFYKLNLNYLFNINLTLNFNLKLILIFILMSLSGLPPFFGFLIKWYRIIIIVDLNNLFIAIFLILCSLFFIYNYLKIIFLIMLNNFIYIKSNQYLIFNNNDINLNFFLFLIIISLIGLFLIIYWFFY